jgi:hypothetical protein
VQSTWETSNEDVAQGQSSTFMTEAPQVQYIMCAGMSASKQGDKPAALLSASTDQRVCLWDLRGAALGQLRQGDRDKAQKWDFPFTAQMMAAARAQSLDRIARQLPKE